jgi:hypothetical protein
MINTKKFLGQCLLAVALAGGALAAMAAPTSYHVTVNTTGLSGTGSLDMYLAASSAGALPLTATLSNFSSDFGAVDTFFSGDYSAGPGGSFVLVNGAGYNDLTRFLSLGGMVGFDIAFSGTFLDTAGPEGALFSVGLWDADGNVVGDPFGIASFTFVATSPTVITTAFDARLGNITAVPEPSALLMMMSGLGLVGFVARRRRGAAN